VNEDGRIQVFAIGADSGLHTVVQTVAGGAWSGWAALGGAMSEIATAVDAQGRIEVFAIGAYSTLHVIRQTVEGVSWAGWEAVNGPAFQTHPTALQIVPTERADGRIELFLIKLDSGIDRILQLRP
jgi:hypothetical protein